MEIITTTWKRRSVAVLLSAVVVLGGLAGPASAQETSPGTVESITLSEPASSDSSLVSADAPPPEDLADGSEPVDATQSEHPALLVEPVEPTESKTIETTTIEATPVLVDEDAVLTPDDISISEPVEAAGWKDASLLRDFEAGLYTGSMFWVTQEITGAADYWAAGHTGQGVDVAIIDTGVNPVKGLNGSGQLVYGPDLSFESQNKEYAFSDTFGHGTHLAGIIAGRDGDPATFGDDDRRFMGMAPDSRLVSVKVGTHDGAVDVSQVIAAIDWVIEHRTDNGLNIRVLNLAYGTDSTQSWRIDPLSYAVDRAWKAGIVVVVSAGNDGNASGLRNPATNRHVIAVGASESNMTYDASDDQLTGFSNCGASWYRPVDVVAPGKSIVSLRSPGSSADVEHPEARVEDRFFLGSGTSQAAAVVSGAAALIIDQRPDITPDEVKALLTNTAQTLPGVRYRCQGAGLIDLKAALDTATPTPRRVWGSAWGTGSLEAARGSAHIQLDGVVLEGEQDIFGQLWDASRWTAASRNGETWTEGEWNGSRWASDGWSGLSWSGLSWSGLSWSGLSWSGLSWSGLSWSGLSWSGLSWSGLSWSGLSWSGLSWSAETWN